MLTLDVRHIMKETLFDSKNVSYALKASFVVAVNWKISVLVLSL